MDLYSLGESITCEDCFNYLQTHLTFMARCVKVEQNIQKYAELKATDREGKIHLEETKQFLEKSEIKYQAEDELTGMNVNKACWKDYDIDNLKLYVKNEEVELKLEDNYSYESNQDMSVTFGSFLKKENDFIQEDERSQIYIPVTNKYGIKHDITNKYGSLKAPSYRHKRRRLPRSTSRVTMHKCENGNCSFITKQRSTLSRHMLIHKSPSEVTMYKCNNENCLYKTRHIWAFRRHVKRHMENQEIIVYKCESCSFETRHKHLLKSHMLMHKDPSEVTIYKCENEACLFDTRYPHRLRHHMLVHKDSSEGLYKCGNENCSYETRYKGNLHNHMIVHRNHSGLYKCKNENCSFETKYKSSLKSHTLIHKNSSEVTMYRCGNENCSFGTKYKHNLKTHMFKHKNISKAK